MGWRADVACVLAEQLAYDFAQCASAGATIALEHERDLGLLIGVLHGPRQPVDGIGVDVVITRGQDFVDVLAQQAPVAAPGGYAPAAPEIELAVDDMLIIRF